MTTDQNFARIMKKAGTKVFVNNCCTLSKQLYLNSLDFGKLKSNFLFTNIYVTILSKTKQKRQPSSKSHSLTAIQPVFSTEITMVHVVEISPIINYWTRSSKIS